MKKAKPPLLSYSEISRKLRDKGFPFVKIELEANIVAPPSPAGEPGSCTVCEGRGWVRCYEGHEDNEEIADCENCNEHGETDCEDCDGSGRESDDEGGHTPGDYLSKFQLFFEAGLRDSKLWDCITFLRVYNDGSVNTEATLTVPTTMVSRLERILDVFRMSCEQVGQIEVERAGMHITLMSQSDYTTMPDLPEACICNFREQMGQIVSSLYVLASGDGKTTRGLDFRRPQVTSNQKYSAIYTHGDRCIEYRIFDTCYANPARLRLFFTVITKSLVFYAARPKTRVSKHQKVSDKTVAAEHKRRTDQYSQELEQHRKIDEEWNEYANAYDAWEPTLSSQEKRRRASQAIARLVEPTPAVHPSLTRASSVTELLFSRDEHREYRFNEVTTGLVGLPWWPGPVPNYPNNFFYLDPVPSLRQLKDQMQRELDQRIYGRMQIRLNDSGRKSGNLSNVYRANENHDGFLDQLTYLYPDQEKLDLIKARAKNGEKVYTMIAELATI